MTAVAVLSLALSNLVTARGKHPLEATALAVVIGVLGRNLGLVPKLFHAGIKQFEKFLTWGVILIGATLNFKDIGSQGLGMLTIILVTMVVSYFVIYALGCRRFLPADFQRSGYNLRRFPVWQHFPAEPEKSATNPEHSASGTNHPASLSLQLADSLLRFPSQSLHPCIWGLTRS